MRIVQAGRGIPSPADRGVAEEPPAVASARGVILDHPAAHDRTDLAEDRTILANERTFAGWMRTSLACVAIGAGFHALLPAMEPAWVPQGIATAFLILAIAIMISAQRRASAVVERLSAHVVVTAKPINLKLFALAIEIGSTALIAAIWLITVE